LLVTRGEFNIFNELVDEIWVARKQIKDPDFSFHDQCEHILSRRLYNVLSTDIIDNINEIISWYRYKMFKSRRVLFNMLKKNIFGDIPNCVFP